VQCVTMATVYFTCRTRC